MNLKFWFGMQYASNQNIQIVAYIVDMQRCVHGEPLPLIPKFLLKQIYWHIDSSISFI